MKNKYLNRMIDDNNKYYKIIKETARTITIEIEDGCPCHKKDLILKKDAENWKFDKESEFQICNYCGEIIGDIENQLKQGIIEVIYFHHGECYRLAELQTNPNCRVALENTSETKMEKVVKVISLFKGVMDIIRKQDDCRVYFDAEECNYMEIVQALKFIKGIRHIGDVRKASKIEKHHKAGVII